MLWQPVFPAKSFAGKSMLRNLKTAKVRGPEAPSILLARANEVIE
jgi:hypothetical protein